MCQIIILQGLNIIIRVSAQLTGKYSPTVQTRTPGSVNSEVRMIRFPPHGFNVGVEQPFSHCLPFLPNAPLVPATMPRGYKLKYNIHSFVQYVTMDCTAFLIILHFICVQSLRRIMNLRHLQVKQIPKIQNKMDGPHPTHPPPIQTLFHWKPITDMNRIVKP